MNRVLFVLGTRPELIKLIPLIKVYKSDADYQTQVCITSQHQELLHDLFPFFDFDYDFDLKVMRENQSLTTSLTKILNGLNDLFLTEKPELIFVQGDTNTAFAGALFGYQNKIKVVHIEAGLRSNDIWSPFPEEGNRKLISQICQYHFCSTNDAKQNLLKENITENVFVVGNTVIDTLIQTIAKIQRNRDFYIDAFRKMGIDFSQKVLLVTLHRRENFGIPLERICETIRKFANDNPNSQFVIPIHPNQNGKYIEQTLSGYDNIKIIQALTYDLFVFLLNESFILLTDSGGIQEEAITSNKPLLILRENTERPEVVQLGAGILVHYDEELIISNLNRLHNDSSFYANMVNKINPFGDGSASNQIKTQIEAHETHLL